VPWSPIPKFPDVMNEIRSKGYTRQVSFNVLRVAIMRHIGLVRSESIANTLDAMEMLGYIRSTHQPGIFDVCAGEPGAFDRRNDEKDAEERINAVMRGEVAKD